MIGIAERHCDKDEPTAFQKLETVLREVLGLQHVLEQIAAKKSAGPQSMQPGQIVGIGQIGADVDPWQITHVDVHDLDATFTQWPKHLVVNPRLYYFASSGRAAAKVEQRRQSLGRKRVKHAAQPGSLGFKHCDLGLTSALLVRAEPPWVIGLDASRQAGLPSMGLLFCSLAAQCFALDPFNSYRYMPVLRLNRSERPCCPVEFATIQPGADTSEVNRVRSWDILHWPTNFNRLTDEFASTVGHG